ncbi:MAG: DUF7009 family protein [Steroidobacteraceae bacterium]
MKLRIKGNALRLRLTQGEIRTLAESGQVQERTEFPGGVALIYRVRSDEKIQDISIDYEGSLIDFRIPARLAARWCGTDLVTLSASVPVPSGSAQVVLEKDYACLVPRAGEDESDHFPHPRAAEGHGQC